MNETSDSKKSMERDRTEHIGLYALGFALRTSSNFKFRGHVRVTSGHDVGVKGSGPLDGTGMSGATSRFHFCPVPG